MSLWCTEDQWFQPWWIFFTRSLLVRYDQWQPAGDDTKPTPPKPALVCVTQGYNEKRTPLVWVRKQPAQSWWRYAVFNLSVVVRFDADQDWYEETVVRMVRACLSQSFTDAKSGARAHFYEQKAESKMTDSRWKETLLIYEVRLLGADGCGLAHQAKEKDQVPVQAQALGTLPHPIGRSDAIGFPDQDPLFSQADDQGDPP